ncbi:EIICBA-Glc (plasmid) [Mesomycoplasma conjunctivae]|uniref:PTS system, glucose-specific IIABC component n=1 Tax=Mycoplasmopsis fermentans (strain M64) TaxID=943945 RepID=A0AB32XBY3_MYCFM|nr:PTS transporter subunit EIIC [Mycoplasmopsis fermentans]ADV34537.1 PTS system, glucose-specific IIABC component [Mycoplasmopsis fermentans M64]VEU64093.1 EIICBA-Glc [Mycoplasmopsis fermentans]VEU66732.1 EIICBA-Glc [Mesomycoplasma conjunctivae]
MDKAQAKIPNKEIKSNPKKGKIKDWFQQLARGLMLPIAILPIAGLLLGIGGAIGANTTNSAGQTTANIFKGVSEVIFGNLPILFCIAIAITFSKDKGGAGFSAAIAYLVFTSSQLAFIQFDGVDIVKSIFWFHKPVAGLVGSNLGMKSLNTSIFGGMVIGIVTAYTFNYFSKIELPPALSFFSGIRLVPIILVPISFGVSIVFLLLWPWIGLAIYELGKLMQRSPIGLDGFIYGILGRALMPFGLHHIPIVLAYQTEFGGVLSKEMIDAAVTAGKISSKVATDLKNSLESFSKGKDVITGDQNIWNYINQLNYNSIDNIKLFPWFQKTLGVNAGRFTQDYPTYIGTCMGIGLAMILLAEKENRKNVAITIGSAMGVAFLTGITEPLEFTFLFIAPQLYYAIYVPLSGLAYALMEWTGAHVGVGFARGFIDLIIYGVIPVAKGTAFYFAFLWALVLGGVAFVTFFFWIKYGKIATPGRLGNNIGLINKKQYQELKQQEADRKLIEQAGGEKVFDDANIEGIVNKLGGLKNLNNVSACATRLRIELKENVDIKAEDFVPYGSFGLVHDNLSVQVILGGKATVVASKINEKLSDES